MENFKTVEVMFKRKRYEIVDFQGREPGVGIFSSYVTFCTPESGEEGYTMDVPEYRGKDRSRDKCDVFDKDGKIIGKGRFVNKRALTKA